METSWPLPTPDGKTIYGRLNSMAPTRTSAIFIVHGLTGHMFEYPHKRAADYFSDRYDVYRFNLYDGAPDARNLVDCTIQTHADDLNAVLREFAGSYQKNFLIGHSYGGPTIMLARPEQVTATSLWDPTFDARSVQENFKDSYLPAGDFYKVEWGVTSLIGKAMYV